MRKQMIKFFLVVQLPVLCGGCGLAKMIATMTSPTSSEVKIKAEYNIVKQTAGKIIVLVDQSVLPNTEVNFRPYLTEAVNSQLFTRAKVKKEFLVPYRQLSTFRSSTPDFAQLAPVQIGAVFGADKVLLIMVEDYKLYNLAETGYYAGSLDTRSFLFDVETASVVWPKLDEGKPLSVEFDSQYGAAGAAEKLLAKITAHCIVRYFYDCPKDKFKTRGEITDPDVKRW